MRLALAVLLLGCVAKPVVLSTDTAGPVVDTGPETPQSDDTSPPDSADTTSETAETADTGEPPETWPQPCEDMYDQEVLQAYAMEISEPTLADIASDCNQGAQVYRPISFTWNGETVPAMARLKGNWTWNCSKYQFVVSFNEEDPDARFHGVRKLVLDAPWYDRTLLHERLAHPLFARLGLPYSCANNARLEINGEYYGLYANLERLDHEYLERNFDDPEGNLYQAGTELETNEETGDTSRLVALQSAHTADDIAALVDLDEATAEWAAEAMIPALDNYWAGVEINYYLYDHPTRGFLYLPYDLDLVFGDSAYGDGTPVWSDVDVADPILWEHTGWKKEPIFKTVLADRKWCNVYVEKLRLARAAYDPAAMAATVDEWDAQISDAYAADPRQVVTLGEHHEVVQELKAFLQARADYVDGWLAEGGHCPARW